MDKWLVAFSHGKESGPWGEKFRALAVVANRFGAEVMSIDYREHPKDNHYDQNAPGEADRRAEQLLSTPLTEHAKLVLVGSSMGGYVSTIASHRLKVTGLFLLAPAFYLPNYDNQAPTSRAKSTVIVHGWSDEVVPVEHSIKFAKQHLCELHIVDGDHRLNDALTTIEPLFELFLKQVLEG
jgi:alpha/beta superfamily hydrolase